MITLIVSIIFLQVWTSNVLVRNLLKNVTTWIFCCARLVLNRYFRRIYPLRHIWGEIHYVSKPPYHRTQYLSHSWNLKKSEEKWNTSVELQVTSLDIRVMSSDLQVAGSTSRVASSNPRVTSSTIRVTSSKTRVRKLRA